MTTTGLASVVLTSGITGTGPAATFWLLINNHLLAKQRFELAIQRPWSKRVANATGNSVTPKYSTVAVGPAPKSWQTATKGLADVVLLANAP